MPSLLTHDWLGATLGLLTPSCIALLCMLVLFFRGAAAPTSSNPPSLRPNNECKWCHPCPHPQALAQDAAFIPNKLSVTCQLVALLDPERSAWSARRNCQYLPSVGPGISGVVDVIPHAQAALRAHPSSESPAGTDWLGNCSELHRAGVEPWAESLEPLSCSVTLSPCPSLSLTSLQFLGLRHPCAIHPVTQPMQGLLLLIVLGPRSQHGERWK